MNTINSEQLRDKISKNDDLLLINVLPKEDFRERHIPNSVNIPVEQDDFAEQVQGHADDLDHEIVVYCANTSCDASLKAVRMLEDAGFTNVCDFEGGIEEWEAAKQPVETGA